MKKIKVIAGLLATIGCFVLFGTAGKMDCAMDIAIKEFIPQIIVGFIMILSAYFVFRNVEERGE